MWSEGGALSHPGRASRDDVVGIAGEWAAEHARTEGAGTFRVKFLDSFDRMEAKDLEAKAKVRMEPSSY